MLTMQIPMLLALLGTALMAVVIFAPNRVFAPVTISFAPPAAPPQFEPREPPGLAQREAGGVEKPESPAVEELVAAVPADGPVSWPALVDPRASGCDAATRLGLVEALGAVRTPWAEAILRDALENEPDPRVRGAAFGALEPSLVTERART